MAARVILAGKYQLNAKIGSGGFSNVYRGQHVAMARDVAVKVVDLTVGMQKDPEIAARFDQEAKIISQLTSESTVTVFDYGAQENLMYLVMEYIEGNSLKQEFKANGGKLDQERVVRCGIAVLNSLEEAHQKGVLHRDLKPANVMVTRDFRGEEQFKVLDFGIATLLDSMAVADYVGTPRYAAPEQLLGRELSVRTDIFGLGSMMWHMLVGMPLVERRKKWRDVSDFHLREDESKYQMPHDAGVDGRLATIVEKACKRKIRERWQDARQMRNALEEWLGGERSSEAWVGGSGQILDPNLEGMSEFIPADDFMHAEGGLARVTSEPVIVVVNAPKAPKEEPLELEELVPPKVNVPLPQGRRELADVGHSSMSIAAVDGSGERRGAGRLRLGLIVAIVVVCGVGGWLGVKLWGGDEAQEQEKPRVAVVTKKKKRVKKPKVYRPKVSQQGVESALEALGWSLMERGDRDLFGTFSQQSALYRKGKFRVEVLWIDAKSTRVLSDLRKNVSAKERFIELDGGRAMRLRPRAKSEIGVEEMAKVLVRYRDLVLSEEAP